jgi:hypothetical protein
MFGREDGFGFGGVGCNLKGRQLGAQLCKSKWDHGFLTPFSRNFYIPHPEVLYGFDTTFVDTLCI